MPLFNKKPPPPFTCPDCGQFVKRHCSPKNRVCDLFVCEPCNAFGNKKRWVQRGSTPSE